jgi:phage-related protein (TIGR01555 family)
MPRLRTPQPVSTVSVPESARGATKRTLNKAIRDEIATAKLIRTGDSFQNFAAKIGIGTDNQTSGSTYGFNPISRNRGLLEWMYRGSWICGKVVDCPADDMTRAGIEMTGDMDPDDIDKLHQGMNQLAIWPSINATAKWGRLYGGAIGVMLIDGQKPETPLRPDTVGKGAFKGLLVLDRWMVQPNYGELVTEFGPDLGKPKFYETVVEGFAIPRMKIHYTRCLRIDGVDLPFWQKITENLYGMSVLERLYDRLVAFDSTTQGAAQLVYKAHLRTLSVEGLRTIIAAGGKALEGLVGQVDMMRRYQGNEGISLIDAKDKFETHAYSFTGLDQVLLAFGQQLSGAADIPLVRLFGQSPAGLNATGDSDIRNYYDGINQQQELHLRRPLTSLFVVLARSLGINLPDGWGFNFKPLWQLSDEEKANVADKVSTAVSRVEETGIISPKIALKELKQSSRVTGIFSNITDEDIEAASDDPPAPSEMGARGTPDDQDEPATADE